MILTNTAEVAVLDSVFSGTGIYSSGELALYSAVADSESSTIPSAGNLELAGNGYARMPYTNATFTTATTVGDKVSISNVGIITYPTASGNWLTATHLAIISSGIVVAFMQLMPPLQANNGQTIQFLAGEIEIELT